MKHTFRYTSGDELRAGIAVSLDGADSHHLTRVVRRRVGDPVEIRDALGRLWPAVVEDLGPPVSLRLGGEPRPAPRPAPIGLHLGQLDAGRLDLVVEKATEIGIARLTVVACARDGRRRDQGAFDGRRDRLERIVDAAARQSGQGNRPEIRGLVPFAAVIGELAPARTFLLDARGDHGLTDALRASPAGSVDLLVGPQSGFAVEEIGAARERGVAICRLGEATLRAETAALVAITLAADALGHLGGGA